MCQCSCFICAAAFFGNRPYAEPFINKLHVETLKTILKLAMVACEVPLHNRFIEIEAKRIEYLCGVAGVEATISPILQLHATILEHALDLRNSAAKTQVWRRCSRRMVALLTIKINIL